MSGQVVETRIGRGVLPRARIRTRSDRRAFAAIGTAYLVLSRVMLAQHNTGIGGVSIEGGKGRRLGGDWRSLPELAVPIINR